MFSATLNDLSWAEIVDILRKGYAAQLFSIGDYKTDSVGTFIQAENYDKSLSGTKSANYVLVEINGNRARFFPKTSVGHAEGGKTIGAGTSLNNFFNQNISFFLPNCHQYVVSSTTQYLNGFSTDSITSKIHGFSLDQLEGGLPYFTTSSSRSINAKYDIYDWYRPSNTTSTWDDISYWVDENGYIQSDDQYDKGDNVAINFVIA